MATSLLNAPGGPSLARQHYRGQARARRAALRVVRLLVYVAMLALVITGWYLAKRGFGRQWRYQLVEELRKRGVEVSIGRLTLDPFRGLIAQKVRIYDFKSRANTLAVINHVALDINYAALFHHEPFLNALDIRDAQLTLPLQTGAAAPVKAQLTKVRAHIFFPPEQIYVSEAEGVFCGVRISATGQLIRRNDYKASGDTSEEEWRRRVELLQRVITELGRFRFEGETPSIQVKFSGDLSRMEDGRAQATVRGERIQRGNYEIKNLAVGAEWADQKLSVTHCEWNDAAGRFSARADWDRGTNEAEFQAHSTIDVRQLLEAFDIAWLSDASFSASPFIDLSGGGDFAGSAPRLNVIGRVAARAFTYKNVPFSDLTADFSWDGARTMLRDVRLRHETGQLTADVFEAPGDFRLNLESTINPAAIAPAAPLEVERFLAEWEWPHAPALRLNVRGTERDPQSWTGDGSIALERARFRGVWMNGATANLRFAEHSINFDNFRVNRDEGAGTGSCAYDFAKREIRLANVRTTLRPVDAIYWIEPRYYKHVAPYKFRQPPNVTVNGVIHFHGPNDHLELLVDAPAGMAYEFLGKTLPFDRISGRLLFTDGRLQLMDMAGMLYDGVARGGADIALSRDDHPYTANVAVEGIEFPQLTDLYFKYETARGRLSGSYDFTGASSDARSMRGAGRLRVTEGNVFAIPIFGPLSGLLSSIIPGAGYSVAHQATASFTIKEGVIHTDDFKVSGKLFGMVGDGDIRFLEDKLDFDVKVSGGGPGVLLTPVYDLFEYKGEGNISKPNWHPKRF